MELITSHKNNFDHKPAVFISSLALYNEGYLNGRWVTIAQLAAGLDWVNDPSINPRRTDEEFFLTDWEYIPQELNISEFTSINFLTKIARKQPALFDIDWSSLKKDPMAVRNLAYQFEDDDVAGMAVNILDDDELDMWWRAQHYSLGSARVALSNYDSTADFHLVDDLDHVNDYELDSYLDSMVIEMQKSLIDEAKTAVQLSK